MRRARAHGASVATLARPVPPRAPYSPAARHSQLVKVAPLEARGPHAFCDKWLEPASAWAHTEPSAEHVRDDLLLVVAAQRLRMPLGRFTHLLRPSSSGVCAGFYADGASNLDHSFPFLRDDVATPHPIAARLHLKRIDLWLGHRSTSRMHYDNLDNLFAQARNNNRATTTTTATAGLPV